MKSFILLSLLLLTSCGDFSNPSSDGLNLGQFGQNPLGSSKNLEANLIRNIGENIITPSYVKLFDDVQNLEKSIKLNCSSDNSRDLIKKEFEKLQNSFHYIEAFLFGPVTFDEGSVLRNIYSKKLTNTCLVDRLVAKYYFSPDTEFRTSFNVNGIDALEYLIYSKNDHSCSRARGELLQWSELSENTKLKSKCHYMEKSVSLLKENIELSKKQWVEEDFTNKMLVQRYYGDVNQTLNVIFKSLFFLELELKDAKLGAPIGKHASCINQKCPEMIEYHYSDSSLRAMYYNVLGFKSIFLGQYLMDDQAKNGFGFDDFLNTSQTRGIEQFKKDMLVDIDNALENFNKASSLNLKNEIEKMDYIQCHISTSTNRTVEICSLHADIKKISDKLKNELTVYLSTLTAPRNAQGDND